MVAKIIKKSILFLISCIFCLSIVSSLFASSVRPNYVPRYVRIAIIRDSPSFSLSINVPFSIFDSNSGAMLYRANTLKETRVCASDSKIKIDDANFELTRLKIVPDTEGAIQINGRRFRGNIEVIIRKENKLLVVNILDLEDYIKGVLYHEVSHFWPMEALKAQAVVSRTYALSQVKNSKDLDYDLTTDFFTQMYGGRTSEKFRTNLTVNQTIGQILTYQNQIFPTYYHATCAGHTEDASNLWNIKLPPLEGTTCNFCRNSPHFKWHNKICLEKISKQLSDKGFKVGKLKDIKIKEKNSSGRISKLELIGMNGKASISGKEFRLISGPSLIRSTNFDVRIENGLADFSGFGWGHGVGFCQWGAYFMSKEGKTYKEILQYYYPGSELKKIE